MENDLLEKAVAAVYRETGLRLIPHKPPPDTNEIDYDATIDMEGYPNVYFTAEVKRWVQHANFGAIVNQITKLPMKGMLVADYVNPKMAERLRKQNVPFIDTVGNAYINEKPVFVYIKANKPNIETGTDQFRKQHERGRAFKPTGLKVLFAFIRNPGLINEPYREIADVADVALGTVGWVINDLKQSGYLIEINKKNRRLKNKKQMLDKWVDAYLEKLRAKQFVGKFSTDQDFWWQEQDYQIADYDAKWGGEAAAAKMTGYLKPEELTIYLPKVGGNQLMSDFRFRKDVEGDINIYRAFWNEEEGTHNNEAETVDPVIVYADLLATGDVRNIETARIIYDQELARFINED